MYANKTMVTVTDHILVCGHVMLVSIKCLLTVVSVKRQPQIVLFQSNIKVELWEISIVLRLNYCMFNPHW